VCHWCAATLWRCLYGTKSRSDRSARRPYLAGARVQRPGCGIEKRKYLNQTVHGGLRRDAQSHLNKMLGERDRGRNLDSSKHTLNQYLDRWLEFCAKPRSRAKSFQDYEGLLRRYVRPRLGSKDLEPCAPAKRTRNSAGQSWPIECTRGGSTCPLTHGIRVGLLGHGAKAGTPTAEAAVLSLSSSVARGRPRRRASSRCAAS